MVLITLPQLERAASVALSFLLYLPKDLVMVRFIEVKSNDEKKKASRIAINDIADYREFVHDGEGKKTIIFQKNGNKTGRVIDVDVKVIDEIVGVECIG